MADRIDEAKYAAMIDALQRFAANVSSLAEQMESEAATVNAALGDEDEAIGEINRQLRASELKYMHACKQALNIASSMQEELDEARKERQVWQGDE